MDKNWYKNQLADQDIRLTESRELVLSVLTANQQKHLTVEEIYMLAHGENPSIGMATVYRTADLLVKHGIVQKFEFGEGKARYELSHRPDEKGHHHHLVCKKCKKIINYDDFPGEETAFLQQVEEGLSIRYGFEVEDHIIQFYGYCQDCRAV